MGNANNPDFDCELFLTREQNTSIRAILPRSSNGKTTDSDSVTVAPKSAILRILDGVCSPRNSADYLGSANFSAEITADIARSKAMFKLRAICMGMGVV